MIRAAFKVHRLTETVFGLAAFLAFLSGLALHWRTYPFPTELDVVRGYGAPLSTADVGEGMKVPASRGATLRHLNDRIVWEIQPTGGGGSLVLDARTGEGIRGVSESDATRVAARIAWNGGEPQARLIRQYDHFYWLGTPPLPAYRVSFRKPRRLDVYVALATGDVTAVVGWRERITDALGEKVHFLKIGPLRTVTTPRFVIMGVLATAVLTGAISGLLYGIPLLFRRLSQTQRWGPGLRSTHNVLGAAVGLFIVLWGTSSYLMLWYPTMDPGPDERARVSGGPLVPEEFRLFPRAAVVGAPSPVFALRATRLLDRPVYDAIHADGSATLIDARTGAVLSPVSDSLVRAIVDRYLGRRAPVRRITYLSVYDEYYHGTHDGRGYSFDGKQRPLPVYRVDLKDGNDPSPLYIRADRGELVGRVGADYRAFRWLGSAVHDLDFPALFQTRPHLWSVAIVAPVLIGMLASATGVWLGATYVARMARARVRTRTAA